jgi:hypothetical protein
MEDKTAFRFTSAFVDMFDELDDEAGVQRTLDRYRQLRDLAVKFVGKEE